MQPDTPIEKIPRIGPVYRQRLLKLRIKTMRDILFHVPSRYEDFSKVVPIKSLGLEEDVTIRGEVLSIGGTKTYRRKMHITEAIIQDDTSAIRVVWFNQPYIKDTLKQGVQVMLSGKTSFGKNDLFLSNPVYEILGKDKDSPIHTGRLVSIYPETLGLSSRWMRMIIKSLLQEITDWEDTLPQEIQRKHRFMNLTEALQEIHFPGSIKSAKRAKERLLFEEMLHIQLLVLQEKMRIQRSGAPTIVPNITKTKRFVESLEFTLTDAQRKASWQILKDLERPHPMNRLLEGDVGSGKTAVAMLASLNVVNAGMQVAVMAPTEILAEQHFKEFSRRLAPERLIIGLYTSSNHKRNSLKVLYSPFKISKTKLKKEAGEGDIHILIGTHALLNDSVKFASLGLLVVDEQHRFGVEQRAKLSKKRGDANVAHLLSMTATPIPRTLALTVYGDLDLSLLDEQPKGRKKIETEVITPARRKEIYDFVRAQAQKGRQTYIIYPLIEESEKIQAKSAVKEYEYLKKEIFPDLRLELLHGKIKAKEKQKILESFKDGKSDILVATSVVEVGIDIPNATVMIIDGAERFGLAQLHQFRGRIGRSVHQSYCFLFSGGTGQKTRDRLKALTTASNGFELAEEDLKIRGPGDLYGVRQSGMPDLAMESLGDLRLVERIREEAKTLLEQNPTLHKWPALQKRVAQMRKTVHFE